MKKLLTAVFVLASVMSCSKNEDVVSSANSVVDTEISQSLELSDKLAYLQNQGYFLFLSKQNIQEYDGGMLRNLDNNTFALKSFLEDEKVISILEDVDPATIAESLKSVESYSLLSEENKDIIATVFNNEKVVMAISDYRRLVSSNTKAGELRMMTYGQFYDVRDYRGLGRPLGKASFRAGAAALAGGGPIGAAVAFMESLIEDILF